jgi:hypothetical protein
MHDLAYTALMAGKFGSIDTCSESQYKAQRHYMVRIARSVPIFMLLGDHDGERGDRADMAEWSPGMRCHTAKGERGSKAREESARFASSAPRPPQDHRFGTIPRKQSEEGKMRFYG